MLPLPPTKTASPKSKWLLVLVTLIVSLFIGVALNRLFLDQPRYAGRSLSSWLQDLSASQSGADPDRQAATNAVRALGPRAIPRLLKLLQFEPAESPTRDRIEGWMNDHPTVSQFLPDLPQPDQTDWPDLAAEGFEILGPVAKSAIPELVRLGADTRFSWPASRSLRGIGPDAIPALTNALAHNDLAIRLFALKTLGRLGLPATNCEPLIASLTHDHNHLLAGTAIMVLGEMGDAAQPEVPHLQELLAGTNYGDFAAYALARLGKLEPLVRGLTNNNLDVRFVALAALNPALRFDPDGSRSAPFYFNPGPATIPWIARDRRMRGPFPFFSRRAVQLLTTNITDADPAVRGLIAEQLGNYQVRAWRAVPALTLALADTNDFVRQNAAEALKKIDVQLDHGGVIRGPRSEKKIALEFTAHTFAEGGETVLNELARHRASASFFVTGDFLTNADFTPLAQRIVAEGHYLGPHGDHHLLYCSWDDRKTLVTRGQFISDLTENISKVQTFANLNPRMRSRYWLPAYEWYNQDIADWSREARTSLISYTPGTHSNADYTGENDANFVSSQAIYDSIVKKEQTDPHGLNGFLLLLHLGAGPGRMDKFSNHYFSELLDYLDSKGYQFVRVDELLDPREPFMSLTR